MPQKNVTLRTVTREDVARILEWLQDKEVSDSWFGRYSYGDPAHLGYRPEQMVNASEEEWERIFGSSEHPIRSIFTDSGEHLGEIHIAMEESLGDGQISILIGNKDHWNEGYGTAALKATLELAFNDLGLYRVWADIPEYNVAAKTMFEHVGFVHEGTLRKSRPHEGARFDSVVMGMLAAEYARLPKDEPEAQVV